MQKIFEELYKGKCWGENVKKAMINETKVQLTEGWDNFNLVLYMKIQYSIFFNFYTFCSSFLCIFFLSIFTNYFSQWFMPKNKTSIYTYMKTSRDSPMRFLTNIFSSFEPAYRPLTNGLK